MTTAAALPAAAPSEEASASTSVPPSLSALLGYCRRRRRRHTTGRGGRLLPSLPAPPSAPLRRWCPTTYAPNDARTHAPARSLAPETRKTRATATAVAAAAARYGWVVARTHARSPLATAARSVGRFFHPTSVRLSTGLHSSEWSSGKEIKFRATVWPQQNENHKISAL